MVRLRLDFLLFFSSSGSARLKKYKIQIDEKADQAPKAWSAFFLFSSMRRV